MRSSQSVERLLAQGWQQHQNGALAEAEALYRHLLQQQPHHPDALHLLGVLLHQSGRSPAAIPLLRQAIGQRPDNWVYYHNLGEAYRVLGRWHEAMLCFQAALRMQPQAAESYSSLGATLQAQGQLAAACQCYHQALRLRPDLVAAHINLGTLYEAQGQLAAAAAHYAQALHLQPQAAEAHFNLANVLRAQGKKAEALAHYRTALRLRPGWLDVYNNLGMLLKEEGQLEAARACYEQALHLEPGAAELHSNLGVVLKDLRQFEAAIHHYREALRLQPALVEAHANLGNVYKELGDYEAAVRHYRQALAQRPHWSEVLCNLGHAYQALGQFAEAHQSYARALACRPDYVEAHISEALLLLVQGRLEEGWEGYEWRLRLDAGRLQAFPFVPWQGERFERGTLVVSAEQGLGDELLFASCLPDALERTGHLVLECDPRLAPLLARSLPRVTVVGQGRHHTGWTKRLPAGTRHCPAGSLPRWLRPTLEAFFPQRLRLRAAPNQIRRWRSWLAGLGPGLKVGVLWRSLRQRAQQGHYAPVGQWQRLWALEGIWWVSLQYDGGKEELEALGETRVVVPELDVWGDLEGVAGLLAGLDLVVGPETALVQLGGALGRRVWCVVAYPGSWPQLGTGGMPWWEGVRYWVAPGPGRWEELFSAMAQELTQLAQQAAGSATAPAAATQHD
ncbi:MAG: hypothetical protein KatS3mg131_1306 [Candidatus Tectimicrobiota bacterium]|nr:MAG: hypothetical protein KatS3mg131_1306 [Candidatus Tectomicrobia bacterium]